MEARKVSVDWAAVQQELISMAKEDLSVRAELAADGFLYRGYNPLMRAVHDRHATRLAQILENQGWPGEPQVGPEGAQAAWLIAQHAIAQPSFQRQALSALSAAARRGEVPTWQVALLEDRIRTLEGLPQRYGTQFDWDASGQLSPLPIEDPLTVDERRQAVGLRPLAQEIQAQREATARGTERPPVDWETRQRERDAWLREVGWRT
jgi:hypothetical protein